MKSERIDKLLVAKKLSKSRTFAQTLIKEGVVEVLNAGMWIQVDKVSQVFPPETELRIRASDSQRFVSRAGIKLAHAIHCCEIHVQGTKVLDVGQSTGGFSDCVLQLDCASVVGVDVGRDQLHESIRNNPKVRCIEGLNARELSDEHVGSDFDLVVMDLSFISQMLVLERLGPLMKEGAALVSLVKPQFEVGPEGIGKGGLVKNENLYQGVERKICRLLNQLGFEIIKYFDSPIAGGDGNKEFFVVARKCRQ